MAGGGNTCKVGEAQFLLIVAAIMGGSLTGEQWDEVAKECGMNKGNTAYCRFNNMKKKYFRKKEPNANTGSTDVDVTPSKFSSKKRKVPDEGDDEDGDAAKKVKSQAVESADIFDGSDDFD